MNIITLNQGSVVYSKDSVTGKKLFSKHEAEAVHMELAPGKSLPEHKTPKPI